MSVPETFVPQSYGWGVEAQVDWYEAYADIGGQRYRMMALEREKRSTLAPLYRAAKEALPKLDISQQNVGYYLEVAVSNDCGRLLANVVIAYNSILLSMLLNRHKANDKGKFLELLRKISPVAWQHIHFLGHYLFRDNTHPIDLEAILANAGFD